jgi:tetratricopeptide (TPR) repeat protein
MNQTNTNSNMESNTISPLVKRILIIAGIVIVLAIPKAILISSTPKSNNKKTEKSNVCATDSLNNLLASLEKAANVNPNAANILALSAAYINSKMPGKAIQPLKKLIKKEPNNANAYNNLGVANIMLKNYTLGIDACKKAISLDTSFQLAKNNLKWGLDEKQKTINIINTLLTTSPDKQDHAFYIQLGLLYMQVGEYNKSIAIWSDGLKKYPSASSIFYNNIGTAQVFNKEYDKAIENFNKALATDPNNQLAKNNIAWAQQEMDDK